jgi:hypothetical protein
MRARSLRVALVVFVVIIVILFAVASVFLFFLVWFFSNEDIRWVCIEAFWTYSAHAQWYARAPWQTQRAIIASMASILQIPTQDTIRHIQRIQAITIVWMGVEAGVSLSAAWMARSPALLAFGGDSAIELLSAVVVLWRFHAHTVQEHAERRASRIAGALLFVLAVYVVAASALTLLGYSEPKPTYLGIAILIAAASVMPWLAKEKRRLSSGTGSAALRADAAQSALCAYPSLIATP